MAVMTFGKIKVEDLNEQVMEAIRALFKDRTVEISLVIKDEDRRHLIGLEEILKRNRESPYIVQFESDFDFDELADQIAKDANFDVTSVFEKRKLPNSHVTAP